MGRSVEHPWQEPDFVERLKNEVEGRIVRNEPLAKHTSLRVGGPADIYLYPANAGCLAALFGLCREHRIPLFVIGYGTNLLVHDDGYRGIVADLSDVARDIVVRGDELVAGGGAWLGDVVRLAAEEGLGGMEKLAGIPGGVGGGLSMNAGAFGMAISDHLVEVETATPDGRLVKMSKSDVGFAYRSAPGLMNKAVVTARFVLPRRRSKDVLKVVEETIAERFRRNTMMLPSAGSVFKNPPGGFAARLIESAGGKGQTAGGAEVSPLHANFIVNARGGTTSDIVTLIRRIRTMVYQTQGVELKLELRTLGFAAPPDEGFDD